MGSKRMLKSELVGLEIMVLESRNKSLEGVSGNIVDETKNTITIETKDKKRKTLIKKDITFKAQKGQDTCIIKGHEIIYRPEERTKRI